MLFLLKKLGNPCFKFKRFRITQDRCAMKVCTDACVLGALASKAVKENDVRSVLDIGSGTGLLSLMIAQENKLEKQEAVEIDFDACEQSLQNCRGADFCHQILIHHQDISSFQSREGYDFIVCNPPFFVDDLPSLSESREIAMHGSRLSPEILLNRIAVLLKKEGLFCLMFPFRYEKKWMDLIKRCSFSMCKIYRIKDREEKPAFRSIVFCKRRTGSVREEEIIIRQKDGNYTKSFKELQKPYYLFF